MNWWELVWVLSMAFVASTAPIFMGFYKDEEEK